MYVARVAAAQFEFDFTGHDVEFVVHHKYFLRSDLEKSRQRTYRLAGQVHVGLRLQKAEGEVFHLPLDLPDAQAVGQWRKDLQGHAGQSGRLNRRARQAIAIRRAMR